jgi:hypothetical protein
MKKKFELRKEQESKSLSKLDASILMGRKKEGRKHVYAPALFISCLIRSWREALQYALQVADET